MTETSNRTRGALMIICSAFSFTAMNVFARLAGDIPASQKSFFRNAVAVILIVILLAREKKPLRIQKGCLRYHILRSLFGTLGVIGNFYAVDHMLLSDATVLVELSPFFVIIFSALLLRERATPAQWALVAVAFSGAALVIRPTGAGFSSPAAPVAVGVALCSGFAYTMVRELGLRGEDGRIIILFFSVFSCVFCLPSMLTARAPLLPRQFFLLLCASVCGCCGQLSVTVAYRYAPAAEISVFDYTSILFSALLGWLIFHQVADALSYAGYAILTAAALAMFFQNRRPSPPPSDSGPS